jgi:cell division protein FtsW (lipid II flippase)
MRYLNRQLVLAGLVMLLAVAGEARSQTVGGRSLPLTEEERLEARERLAELGYWLDPENDPQGVQLRHALIAFQKVEGRARTGRLTRADLEVIRLAIAARVRGTPP